MNKYIIPAAVVVIIAIAVIATNSFSESSDKKIAVSTPSVTVSQPSPTQPVDTPATHQAYPSGTYEATGHYVSPGGPREVNVSVVLENGTITDATFVGLATDPTSMRFQGEFADNYKPMVIGKNIDEVSLTKVAGSSLTSKGFNDALNQIKEQAQS